MTVEPDRPRSERRERGATGLAGGRERDAGERLSRRRAERETSGPVAPRAAASVMLLRTAATGRLEVFMVRRSEQSRFAADVYVFPGGTVRSSDQSPAIQLRAGRFTPEVAHRRLIGRGGETPPTPEASFGLHVAALRELFEEAGVLLAADRRGRLLTAPEAALADRLGRARARLQAGEMTLDELLAAEGLVPACEELVYYSHWVTPASSPRRFDTRFFVAAMPAGQTALHCQIETTAGEWVEPAVALDRYARGDLKLMLVTVDHLRRLAAAGTVAAAFEVARTKPIRTVHPWLDPARGAWALNVAADAW